MASSEADKPLRRIAASFEELAAVAKQQQPAGAGAMEVGDFSRACSHISVLFGCLGIAFKFAEMDYVSKDRYHLIGQAASEMLEEGSVDDQGAQAMTPTYVSAYGLVEQISELQDELHYHQHELENVRPRERGTCINELCRMIQTLEQILSVPLAYVQLKLTPWPLVQALGELEMVNQQVSACVNEVTMVRDRPCSNKPLFLVSSFLVLSFLALINNLNQTAGGV